MRRLGSQLASCAAAGTLLVALAFPSCATRKTVADPSAAKSEGRRVLVFSRTKGWVHSSIPYGVAAIQQLGREHGFLVDDTKDATRFTDDTLKTYSAVVFLNTTGNVLNAEQQAAFERYIQAGGGYVGIHSAAATEREWPWYGQLMGAYLTSHPHNPNVRKATVDVTDTSHPSTSGLPRRWERTDEWYNFGTVYAGVNVVASLDENTYEGGTNGGRHPIAWYHEFDGGRAFYTGGGHEDANFSEPLFLTHLLGGIRYAMGSGRLDYSKAHAVAQPEENRFFKTVLVDRLYIPMELAVSDDGRVFFTELRTGKLQVYDVATSRTSLVHQLEVCVRGGTGLIGVTLDPGFAVNRHLYLYYAPPTEAEPILFNLSRFTLTPDGRLDRASEKVLLRVPVEERSGAHHGGSMAWDKNGNLYLSTGDSSSPFPAKGYAPLDERAGGECYSLDAQRGSSNTNDFKGKILRIHPEADGSYTIPAGNLFPPGAAKTRPEIYVMGCRNPYRIAVNRNTSAVYWGDIGPDAGEDSPERGPRGYDEFNQAREAGNFGWPYFIADNQAYSKWDFSTETPGPRFDPKAPVNRSPNNTGLTELPPAKPAMIWYPYKGSKEFPEMGEGGRSAMVGDFFWSKGAAASDRGFPDYFDGALFVFEWMRNWVMALRFDAAENYVRSEPLMSQNGDFRRPIDLAFGKDGVMYMLEFGSVYGVENEDARLVKIEYNRGNRPPIAKAGIVDPAAIAALDKRVFLTSERNTLPPARETAGAAPLTVSFSSQGSRDLDDDDVVLTYEWRFDGKQVGATTADATHTYTEPGVYTATLRVTDPVGQVGTDSVVVKVGNAPPQVAIVSGGNRSFFWEGKPFRYSVRVEDKEDGAVDPGQAEVRFEYSSQARAPRRRDAPAEAKPWGLALIEKSDCRACHRPEMTTVGPSYLSISRRYQDELDAVFKLSHSIVAGGGGRWGETPMSAHPQISVEDAREMASYIMSLAKTRKPTKILKPEGVVDLNEHTKDELRGVYTLTATYTDKGHDGAAPLTGREVITLRRAKVRAAFADAHVGFERFRDELNPGDHKAHLLLRDVDLTGIHRLTYEYASEDKAGEIETRIDSQAGPVIARAPFKATGDWEKKAFVTAEIGTPIAGRHDVYFIVIKRDKPNDEVVVIESIQFDE